jgi:hypothetical protein
MKKLNLGYKWGIPIERHLEIIAKTNPKLAEELRQKYKQDAVNRLRSSTTSRVN